MVLRDGKCVLESKQPPDPAPENKKKRLVTATMRAAAKRSAQSSTGPKTLEGKQKSALNATKSAHTCMTMIFLEDESIADFDAEVALTARRLGAKTEPEIEQVRTAVYHQWKAKRIERAEVSSVNLAVNSIVDSFYDSMDSEVHKLTTKLTEAPADTIAGLMQTTAGCSYLIEQFVVIQEWLADCPCFEMSMREHALRLGGHDPRHLFRDSVVMDVDRAYLGAIAGAGAVTPAAAAATFEYDCPEDMSAQEFERRMSRLVIDLPDKADAQETLQNYVDDHLKTLREWRSLIALREERNQADAIGAARSTTTPDGDRRCRYVATSLRLSNGAFRLLFQMQQERRKYGEGDLEGLEEVYGPAAQAEGEAAPAATEGAAEPGPAGVPEQRSDPSEAVAEAPQTEPAAAPKNECKNEPQATQVAGGIGTEPAVCTGPARVTPTSVLLGAVDHEATRALYRHALETVEEKLNQCPPIDLSGLLPGT